MPSSSLYRIYNEDCFDTFPRLADASIDLVLVDPPYGTTACSWDSIIPLEPMWKELKRVAKPNAAIVIMASQPFTSVLISGNLKMFKYCWVWDKGQGTGFLNAEKQPLKCCEDIVVFYSNQPTYVPQMRTGFKPYTAKHGHTGSNYNPSTKDNVVIVSSGERFPINRLEYIRDASKIHPTQKPVELMEYLIKTYTNAGDTVLDFAMGSGTTGVACMNLGRRFIGCDNDTEYGYFDTASERIEKAHARWNRLKSAEARSKKRLERD